MKQNNKDKRNKGTTKSGKKSIKSILRKIVPIRQYDLTAGMIRVIIICWVIPFMALSIVLFYSSEVKTNEQIKDTVTTSMENAADIFNNNIMDAMEKSRQASYDGVIRESYLEFMKTKDENTMYNKVSEYLNKTYKYSPVISNTIILFKEQIKMQYYTYSNVAGATYDGINAFRNETKFAVAQVANSLGTGIKLVPVSDHLYLVRNLVTSDYEPFANIVMEINTDQLFEKIENVVWYKSGLIYLDDELVCVSGNMDEEELQKLKTYSEDNVLNKGTVNVYDENEKISYLTTTINGQKLTFVVNLDKVGILNEKNTVIYIYSIIIVLLIPLLFATIFYFYNNISKPISDLMYASEKIEEGEYGYKISKFDRNREFGKLIDTFNEMSTSLEESFAKIYAEEIATRDANIKALQSQINPHFLNNTLEIINWKVRMSGNQDVSRMIESLGVMMEAVMNRKNEGFIPIKEELEYVDAYLYIIAIRFGDKFRFSKEIDESLLDIKIPRLIIQPLVENMVDHGGDSYGNRVGKLKIFKVGNKLHIVVENNGNISEKEAEKIELLLSNLEPGKDLHNIGIRNVNLRLKMLYGKYSGLTISNREKDLTVSEIIIDLVQYKEAQIDKNLTEKQINTKVNN